jgi:hypothetical protein
VSHFVRNWDGVQAIPCSVIESAKLAGLEPSAYIRDATRRAIEAPGTVTLPADLTE